MADRIRELIEAFGNPEPPAKISQRSLDPRRDHLERLCKPKAPISDRLGLHQDTRDLTDEDWTPELLERLRVYLPDPLDLCLYMEDISYGEIDRDFFRYVFPIGLYTWERDFWEGDTRYGRFTEKLAEALGERKGFRAVLTDREYAAVASFMRNVILDLIDRERHVAFLDQSAEQPWRTEMHIYATAYPDLGELWERWWNADTTGRACAVWWFIEELLTPSVMHFRTSRDDKENAWHPDNVAFAKRFWTIGNLRDAAERAVETLRPRLNSDLLRQMMERFDTSEAELDRALRDVFINLTPPNHP